MVLLLKRSIPSFIFLFLPAKSIFGCSFAKMHHAHYPSGACRHLFEHISEQTTENNMTKRLIFGGGYDETMKPLDTYLELITYSMLSGCD